MERAPNVETFRWKGRIRRFLGADLAHRDADGASRAVAEGGWLAVAYPEDRSEAYVETVERARATRSFSAVRLGSERNGNQESILVSRVRLESAVGIVEWEADAKYRQYPVAASGVHTHPFMISAPGVLTLPSGERRATDRGSGFFEAKDVVHAFETWRDADLASGWKATTEVDLDMPDEWRPLLAALPLLLFTAPPGLFG